MTGEQGCLYCGIWLTVPDNYEGYVRCANPKACRRRQLKEWGCIEEGTPRCRGCRKKDEFCHGCYGKKSIEPKKMKK